MRKSCIALFLVITFSLLLTGCGGGKKGGKGGGEVITPEPEIYTVTFENVDTPIQPVMAKDNTTITLPTPAAQTGFNFDGWYDGKIGRAHV